MCERTFIAVEVDLEFLRPRRRTYVGRQQEQILRRVLALSSEGDYFYPMQQLN